MGHSSRQSFVTLDKAEQRATEATHMIHRTERYGPSPAVRQRGAIARANVQDQGRPNGRSVNALRLHQWLFWKGFSVTD